MKKISLSLFLFAMPCISQSTHTAASCNYSDVNAIISGPTHVVANGDTIIIPAGSCTWTSGITVSGVGFTIMGQGTPNTGPSTTGAGTSTVNLTQNTNAALFAISNVPVGQLMRYSLMSISPQSGLTSETVPIETSGTCTASGCPNIRVDNITFASGYVNDPAQAYTISNNMFGVYDHNTFNGPGTGVGAASVQISFSSWQGIGDSGDESYFAPDSTGTSQALFQENNIYNGARGSENDVGFNGLGGDRYVNRYNISNNTPGTGFFSNHGTAWTGRDRGGRQKEVYRNQINCSSAVGSCGGGNFLSGTGYVFENAFVSTGTGFFNQYLSVDSPRVWRAAAVWQYCSGAGPYDQNDGTVYASGVLTSGGTSSVADISKSWTTNQWAGSALTAGTPYSIYDTTLQISAQILSNTSNTYTFQESFNSMSTGDSYQILRATLCTDQAGRTQGTYLSGTSGPNGGPTPTGWSSQVLDPVYEFGDTHSGNFGGPVNVAALSLLPNRDIYWEVSTSPNSSPTSPFNGTTGTGFGTLANRPTTCTQGVAYWATDQGSWNLAPGGEQGELFKCTSANTWSLAYTPYTYPHPLTTGGTTFTWMQNVSPSGGGTITGSNSGSGSYPSGTTIGPLTATANSGYSLASTIWTGISGSATCSGSTNPTTSFSLAANSGCTANFTANSYTLSTATAGTGTGTITGCAGSVTYNTSYSCTVTPTGGSTLASVTGCGGSGTTTYTGTMPASNCTVTATFNSSSSPTPPSAVTVILSAVGD